MIRCVLICKWFASLFSSYAEGLILLMLHVLFTYLYYFIFLQKCCGGDFLYCIMICVYWIHLFAYSSFLILQLVDPMNSPVCPVASVSVNMGVVMVDQTVGMVLMNKAVVSQHFLFICIFTSNLLVNRKFLAIYLFSAMADMWVGFYFHFIVLPKVRSLSCHTEFSKSDWIWRTKEV